jgi:hypothetical protein
MLFDLRSRGRRRVIQVVYAFLAILIGGGLVLFGVGGGAGSTGLLSQLAQQGNGSSTGVKIDETAMLKAQRVAEATPSSASAWDSYASAVFRLADTNYVSSEEGFTTAGAKELAVLKRAWNHYLSLNPAKPDTSLATDVAFAFGSSGISEFGTAEAAEEIVAENNPKSYADYAELAYDAYYAKQRAQAELAQARAIALAPKADRKELASELAQVAAATGATASTGTTGTSG